VAPEEEGDLRGIERAIGRTLPRITLPDFDYKAKPHVRLEIPNAQRIAAIRAQKAEERARARSNTERRAATLRAASTGRPAEQPPPTWRGKTRPSAPASRRRRRPPRHRP
jgi:ATP-dependent RNA helicase RhlE